MPFTTCAVSVFNVTAMKNRDVFSSIVAKSGGKKSYGPKWRSRKNVGTKMWFSPKN